MAGRFWQCVPQFKCTVWQIRVTNSHNSSTKQMVLFIWSFFLTQKQISSFLMVYRVATFLLCRKLLTHVKGFPVNLTVNSMLPSIHCLCFADQIQVKKVSTGAPVTDVSHLVRRKVRKQKLVYAAINISFVILLHFVVVMQSYHSQPFPKKTTNPLHQPSDISCMFKDIV